MKKKTKKLEKKTKQKRNKLKKLGENIFFQYNLVKNNYVSHITLITASSKSFTQQASRVMKWKWKFILTFVLFHDLDGVVLGTY